MHADLVGAAVAAAQQRNQTVAEVPLAAIAKAAGISRSTLIRRLGGTRANLDNALRQAGVDPGGKVPVRDRAVAAAGRLIAESGLAALTLEGVAEAAACAVPTLHITFGNRDGLLTAVFDHFGPVPDLRQLAEDPPQQLEDAIHTIYRALAACFTTDPPVLPAMFADLLARPNGPARRLVEATLPSMIGPLDAIITPHVRAGRLRPMPLPLLVQLLVGPLISHLLTRPALEDTMTGQLPALPEVCRTFAEAFLRAVGT